MDPNMNTLLSSILNDVLIGSGDSDKHLLTLFSIAVSLGAKNILELGVRDGKTTLPLLMAAKINSGKVTSIDINDTTFNPPDDLKNLLEFKQIDALEYLENVNKKEVFDLIYIDDWHAYKHVKKELDYIDKIVSPKSIILLHDLMYGNHVPHYHSDLTLKDGQWAEGGPYRAVAELNPQFWEFSTIPVNNGLTILRKKYTNLYHS
uniref:Methyltransferase n=1 Tax=viral metagenome TaxID=1070528 RepID=A0A6C0ERQ3_9ZZZZ